MTDATLHPDRLFPTDPTTRRLARDLFQTVETLPIVSPHGHTDPAWWGENPAFTNAADLFVIPDHYVVRMLVSQGVPFEALGIGAKADPRAVWRTFAAHYHLFAATPSRLWLDHAFQTVFGLTQRLTDATADTFYDTIGEALATPAFRPRALYDRFNIEVIATTDSALDDLAHHQTVQDSDWTGRVVPTYRPDACVDPAFEGFAANVDTLGALTGCDTTTWQGYLEAHRKRRAYFIAMGATATDHGHPTAATLDLPEAEATALFDRVTRGAASAQDAEAFRAQMLTEMARMSLDDGLVMQLHAGSSRNHSTQVHRAYGRDRGFDIPARTDWVGGLGPLLNAVGLDPRLTLILFTLDETTYARELAPLAGAYPCLKLGPPWWFHDSPEGMLRYRERVTETAGFANTAGFNDDTRALCSIPARHDMARRVDCTFLAQQVVTHRLSEEEAARLAIDLAGGLARKAYTL
ncbi:uronate isomerase [Jannaschia pagri]|uniref:Uronate isomerase n=1 Tax=Jannaschia pagri TaxID=2829797 RepID=A0ABQ4NM65_9RHOB|nr:MULTISPECIES: glucuronate isomerase [unclassified Jannaschia]GIT91612.1 uronate isomerase [Jannaschia sp. AI_61]GIT95446.1 uronate isomerase [Jannaschia sp. AI_62]